MGSLILSSIQSLSMITSVMVYLFLYLAFSHSIDHLFLSPMFTTNGCRLGILLDKRCVTIVESTPPDNMVQTGTSLINSLSTPSFNNSFIPSIVSRNHSYLQHRLYLENDKISPCRVHQIYNQMYNNNQALQVLHQMRSH